MHQRISCVMVMCKTFAGSCAVFCASVLHDHQRALIAIHVGITWPSCENQCTILDMHASQILMIIVHQWKPFSDGSPLSFRRKYTQLRVFGIVAASALQSVKAVGTLMDVHIILYNPSRGQERCELFRGSSQTPGCPVSLPARYFMRCFSAMSLLSGICVRMFPVLLGPHSHVCLA